MTNLQTKLATDTWITATWQEYIQLIENPAYQKPKITAFKILGNNGSQGITISEILPELAISLLEEGLHRSRTMDNTEVGNWFLQQVQA